MIKKIASTLIVGISSILRPISLLLLVITQRLAIFRFLKLEFKNEEDDIFIVTYPRSGTTLLQMVLYQLTSDGNMDFVHISEKVPFLERIPVSKFGLEDLNSPRIFKTHLSYRSMPKVKGKYILGIRNGKDVAVSYYHHYQNYQNYKGSFSEFLKRFLNGKVVYGSWFKHTKDWLDNPQNVQLKIVDYDKLTSDMRTTIKEIADFCDIEVNDEKLDRVIKNCSFENMKLYEDRFDHATELLIDNGVSAKKFIRKGKSGGWKDIFSDSEIKLYESKFKIVLSNYSEIFTKR